MAWDGKIARRYASFGDRPTSLLLDASKSGRAIFGSFAGNGASLSFADLHTELAFTIFGLFAAFVTHLKLSTRQVFATAIFVEVIAADLGSTGIDMGVIVVAIDSSFASGANAVSVTVFVCAAFLWYITAVIDKAIAIIVEFVAATLLSGRQDLAFTEAPCVVGASLCASAADTNATGSGRSSVTSARLAIGAGIGATAFINCSIAVIV